MCVSTQPKRTQARQCENIRKQWALRNMILLWKKGWALCQRVSELLLSPKEGWRRIKWNLYVKEHSLKDGHPPERKGWALYRRVSELLLNPKEQRRREWEEWLQDRRKKDNRKWMYKHLVWCNLMYKKVSSLSGKDL